MVRMLIVGLAAAVLLTAFGSHGSAAGAEDPQKEETNLHRWRVRVDAVDIGQRKRDERPAEVAIEVDADEVLDTSTLRVIRTDAEGRPVGAVDTLPTLHQSLPCRWYDGEIPYNFPEFHDSVSRTAGKLKPKLRERGGYYLNALGSGRRGRVVWSHTQINNEPAWYVIEAKLLAPNTQQQHLPPQHWVGDGQARCAEKATNTVHSDHLRMDVDDWNNDGRIDLVVGDSFGHLVWWPNLGTPQVPKYEYTRLIRDVHGEPIDVGVVAAPKVCDWDNDGDRDLLVGTERNRIVWFENTGSDLDRKLSYRGLVMLDGEPLQLPVTPLIRGEPKIFKLDYYPVLEFVDWDADGDNDLLAGGYITGCIFLYENTGQPQGSPPKLVAKGPLTVGDRPLNVGHWCAAPCAVDLDNDGDLDLLSGHTPMRAPGTKAGIRFFENIGSRSRPKLRSDHLKTEHLWNISLGSPRAYDWDNDGDDDLVLAVRSYLALLENTGSRTAPQFAAPPITILPQWGPAPVQADQLLDWNGDGKLDLVNGFRVRLNSGKPSPWEWQETIELLPPGVTIQHRSGRGDEEHSTHLDDFDGDGAIDVLFGDWYGHVWLHRNRGTSAKPDLDITGIELMLQDGTPVQVGPIGRDPDSDFTALQGARTVVAAGDFDGDGRRDLIVGDTFGKVRFFRQVTVANDVDPTFAAAIEIGDLGIRLNVCATDWNQDGKTDVIAGSANGKVQVFLNTAGNTAGNSKLDGSGGGTFAAGFTPNLPPIMQPRVLLGDFNGDGDDDLYFPSTQGSCFVERSFQKHGYARGVLVVVGS